MRQNRQNNGAARGLRVRKLAVESLEQRSLLSVTLLSEGFEGAFPSGNGWAVADSNPAGTPAYWDDVNSPFGGEGTHGGSWKAYCAGKGHSGTASAPVYQNSMTASMTRSIDLSGFSKASLRFWYKIPSLPSGGYDRLRVYIDSAKVFDTSSTATSWTERVVSLDSYVGATRTLKFVFESNGSGTAEGAYLDDILVTGDRAAQAPSPEILSITCPSSIRLGEWANVAVVVRNNGGPSTEGGISVSIPGFTSSGDGVRVVNNGSDSDSPGYSEYPAGSSIWHKNGRRITAQYMLVEWVDVNWTSAETNTLRFRVQPKVAGTFTLNVRSAMGLNNVYYGTPTSGPQDQQGWWVRQCTTDVKPNQPPSAPSNPSPADDANNVSPTADLGWSSSDPDGDTLYYTVYFAKDDSTPGTIIKSDASGSSADPGTLLPGAHYYWQVRVDDHKGGVKLGPVWDFVTQPPPAPEILSVIFPSAMTLGDWAEIAIRGINRGGRSTEGGLSLSLPGLSGSGDGAFAVDNGSDSDSPGYSEYVAGSSIWHKNGKRITAQYMLVEFCDTNWTGGETNTLRVRVQPKVAGKFPLYVRSAMELNDVWYVTPTSGPLDQQGWWTRQYFIDVKPNRPPALKDLRVTPAQGTAETTFRLEATYSDPDGQAPSRIEVNIDGSGGDHTHAMTLVSGSPATGAVYRYETRLARGDHSFYAFCEDGHGASATSPVVAGPTVVALPAVTIVSGPKGTIDYDDVVVVWSGSDEDGDLAGYEYQLDQDGWLIIASPLGTDSATFRNVSQGSHEFKVRAIDGKGNLSPWQTLTFTVDTDTVDAIEFAGMTWHVKQGIADPFNNDWSNTRESVWVDGEGSLHLKIRNIHGFWHSAEVFSEESFGYGSYTFYVSSNVDRFDENTVAGLFTYRSRTEELDVEFLRWGDPSAVAGQYVVQPWDHAGNVSRFDAAPLGDRSTHRFVWGRDSVAFESYHGHSILPEDRYLGWNYVGPDIPRPADEKVHINFWLREGVPPASGQEQELVIKAVAFGTADLESRMTVVTAPGSWGETLGAELRVANVGLAAAATCDAVVVLSTDRVIGNADDLSIGTWQIPGLAAGADWGQSLSWRLPKSPPSGFPTTGPVYVGLMADPGGLLPNEAVRDNNPAIQRLALTAPKPEILVVTDLVPDPADPSQRVPLESILNTSGVHYMSCTASEVDGGTVSLEQFQCLVLTNSSLKQIRASRFGRQDLIVYDYDSSTLDLPNWDIDYDPRARQVVVPSAPPAGMAAQPAPVAARVDWRRVAENGLTTVAAEVDPTEQLNTVLIAKDFADGHLAWGLVGIVDVPIGKVCYASASLCAVTSWAAGGTCDVALPACAAHGLILLAGLFRDSVTVETIRATSGDLTYNPLTGNLRYGQEGTINCAAYYGYDSDARRIVLRSDAPSVCRYAVPLNARLGEFTFDESHLYNSGTISGAPGGGRFSEAVDYRVSRSGRIELDVRDNCWDYSGLDGSHSFNFPAATGFTPELAWDDWLYPQGAVNADFAISSDGWLSKILSVTEDHPASVPVGTRVDLAFNVGLEAGQDGLLQVTLTGDAGTRATAFQSVQGRQTLTVPLSLAVQQSTAVTERFTVQVQFRPAAAGPLSSTETSDVVDEGEPFSIAWTEVTGDKVFAPLVDGVSRIATSALPGPILVSASWTPIAFGDADAYYALGSEQRRPAVVAAARLYERGRVLALGHEGFFQPSDLGLFDNDRFGRNILPWLDLAQTQKVCVRRTEWSGTIERGVVDRMASQGYRKQIVSASDMLDDGDLAGCGVLVYATRWAAIQPAEIDTVVRFAANGGSVLLVGLGWSYKAYVNSDLTAFPMNQVGQRFGVYFEDGFLTDPTNYISGGSCHPVFTVFSPPSRLLGQAAAAAALPRSQDNAVRRGTGPASVVRPGSVDAALASAGSFRSEIRLPAPRDALSADELWEHLARRRTPGRGVRSRLVAPTARPAVFQLQPAVADVGP